MCHLRLLKQWHRSMCTTPISVGPGRWLVGFSFLAFISVVPSDVPPAVHRAWASSSRSVSLALPLGLPGLCLMMLPNEVPSANMVPPSLTVVCRFSWAVNFVFNFGSLFYLQFTVTRTWRQNKPLMSLNQSFLPHLCPWMPLFNGKSNSFYCFLGIPGVLKCTF